MTNQRDPKRDPMYRADLRRERGEWNIWPLLLGGIFVILFGYMLFAPNSTTAPTQQTSIEQTNPTNSPGTTKSPTPAPPDVAPPKQ